MRKKGKKFKGEYKRKKNDTWKVTDFLDGVQAILDGTTTVLAAYEMTGLSMPTAKKYMNEFLGESEVYDNASFEKWYKSHNGEYDGSYGTYEDFVSRVMSGDKPFRELYDFEKKNR
jgi:hypothetical protein